jgi:hypothetical protein
MLSIILSFDTEDFVTPESDDALAFLAEELRRRDIRGCFALVGDKLRALRQRGRQDVIDRLRDHEVDYHSNDHHFFPLLAPTIEGRGWEESLAWVLEHEARGVAEIEQTFGRRPTAYIKADSHWTPQTLHAYRLLGMSVYSSRHFAAADPAPWWYMNLLSLPYSAMFDTWIAQDGTPRELLARSLADVESLAARAGEEGVITLGTHPCMWSCSVFYDIHNVPRRGHPPAREKWGPAPLLPEWRVPRDRKVLRVWLDEMLDRGVQFTTYADLAESYRQPAGQWLTRREVTTLAERAQRELSATRVGKRWYSAAEALAALCYALSHATEGQLPARVPVRRPLGPTATPSASHLPLPVCARAVAGAATYADRFIEERGEIPAGVDVGGHHFPAAQLLQAVAQATAALAETGKACGTVLQPGPDCPVEVGLLADSRISAWAMAPDYHAPGLLEIGRLQSWTLKPA